MTNKISDRFSLMWLRYEGHEVYGAALLLNNEVFGALFNTQDLAGQFKVFANKRPVQPNVEGMSPKEEAEAWLKHHEADQDWVAFHKHVVEISKELDQRLKCEKVVSVRGTADKLVEKCGFNDIIDACVPWELESERVAAPPSNAAAPASKPIVLKVPEFSAAPQPPFHPDSSVHLEQLPAARRGVEEEVGDLLDGTDAIADHEISEVKPNVPNKKV